MATVNLAHDMRHDRKVALKVLKPELAAMIRAERFLVEIRTTANLQHPHILPLFDSGEEDGFLFYVMPFVEGESLREKLDRERSMTDVRRSVPPHVSAVLAKALEKLPADRFESAEAFASVLDDESFTHDRRPRTGALAARTRAEVSGPTTRTDRRVLTAASVVALVTTLLAA